MIPSARPQPADAVEATERWFSRNGLPYFVPAERVAARDALRPRKLAPLVLLLGLLGLGSGAGLSLLSGDVSFLPATLTQIGILAVVVYAVTQLRFRPVLTWAAARTVASWRLLVEMTTRALPLLLVFVTFLFINAEVWQLSASLDGGTLWLTVLLFAATGVIFFLVRVRDEVDRVDREFDNDGVVRACRGTPMEEESRRLAERGVDLGDVTSLRHYERVNLLLVMLVVQTVQVLFLAAVVLVFFLVFGAITMDDGVASAWTQGSIHHLPVLSHLSVELLQVSVFLAAFSGLYFTVYALTDEVYREQFLSGVIAELERAAAVRAAYLELREERGLPDIAVAEPEHDDERAGESQEDPGGSGDGHSQDPPSTRRLDLPEG